jgi:hypothetical protein
MQEEAKCTFPSFKKNAKNCVSGIILKKFEKIIIGCSKDKLNTFAEKTYFHH